MENWHWILGSCIFLARYFKWGMVLAIVLAWSVLAVSHKRYSKVILNAHTNREALLGERT